MNSQLYPLKFSPILLDKIWGGTKLNTLLSKSIGKLPNIGESWELSGLPDNESKVTNGFLKNNTLTELIEIYMGDLVGEAVYEKFGNEFPLLIKFIEAKEPLSIQVHPDDKLAAERHNAFGKTEMWYVIQADENSQLISGFEHEISPETYVKAVENKQLESLLAKHTVKAGDVFFIPAGRVHAIGAGILLAEIQQTSDLTYRIYDFDRQDSKGNFRELHTELAKDAIDYKIPENYRTNYTVRRNESSPIVESQYFITNFIEANRDVERDYYALDSFVILICVEGGATIIYGDLKTEKIAFGETVLIPADLSNIKIRPLKSVKLLEVYVTTKG